MLSITELENTIDFMRSGELEKNFRESGEIGKGELLELLEKLMDAGEMADEVATRLIYRGLPGTIPSSKTHAGNE